MTEFTNGLFGALKSLNANGSLLRTGVYTIGHMVIAVSCVMLITGSTFWQAVTDASVEPILNSVWFYILDRFWASHVASNQHNKQLSIKIEPQLDWYNVTQQSRTEPDLDLP